MQKLFFIIIAGLLFSSCHTSRPVAIATKIENDNFSHMNGGWQLQMLFASDNNWKKKPILNFDVKEGIVSGNSGCNSLRGKFSVSGNYFGIDKNIISKKMACADAKSNADEKAFISALLKINRFTLVKDELELGQGEITLMRFKRNTGAMLPGPAQ